MFHIEGKVVLITGGAEGIGLACAKEFLKNGAKGVTIADINKKLGLKVFEELCHEFGENKVLFVQVDVANKIQFENAFEATIDKFNQLDILINNAGIYNENDWERMVAVNMNGCIHGTLLAFETYIPMYKSCPEGLIINISSIACAYIGGFNPVYTATKHAIVGLSRSLGFDLHYQKSKVKIISVCPGVTDTGMIFPRDDQYRNQECKDIAEKVRSYAIKQSVSHVAESIIDITKRAETGSTWFVEDNKQPYEAVFPPRHHLRRKNI